MFFKKYAIERLCNDFSFIVLKLVMRKALGQKTWEIRQYRTGDEKRIINMLNKLYTIPRNEDWWQWKFQRNPAGKSIILVAVDGDEIVGHYALIPWRFKLAEQNILAYQDVDAVTHAGYQKQGIFTSLANMSLDEAKARGAPFVFGFPNKVSLPGHLKVGWHIVTELRYLLKILNPLGIIYRKFISTIFNIKSDFPSSISGDSDNKIEFRLLANDSENNICKQVESTKPIIATRDYTFLNWRYKENPENLYFRVTYEEHGNIKGYIIFRMKTIKNLRMGIVVDFIVPPNRYDIAKYLLKTAESKIRSIGADCIFAIISQGTVQLKTFIRKGFFNLPKKSVIFAIVPLNANLLLQLLKAENWFLTFGDSDFM